MAVTPELWIPVQLPELSLSLEEQANWISTNILQHPELRNRRTNRVGLVTRAATTGSPVNPGQREYPAAVQAISDIREWIVIWKVLQPSRDTPLLWERFCRILGDDATPSKSSPKSDARNIQFELFTEAILRQAGLEPQHEEPSTQQWPDFIATWLEKPIAVECKRIRSLDGLCNSLKVAKDQLQSVPNAPGFVLLDISGAGAASDNYLPLSHSPCIPSLNAASRQCYIENIWNRFGKQIVDIFKHSNIIQLCFIDRITYLYPMYPNSPVDRYGTIYSHTYQATETRSEAFASLRTQVSQQINAGFASLRSTTKLH